MTSNGSGSQRDRKRDRLVVVAPQPLRFAYAGTARIIGTGCAGTVLVRTPTPAVVVGAP